MFSIVTRSPADLALRSNARQAGGRRCGLGDAGGIGIIKQIPKLLQVAKKGRLVPFCRLVWRLLAPLKKLDPRLESLTPARVS